jgi:hypothetical protein
LDSVDAALILEAGVGALTMDLYDDFAGAVVARISTGEDLTFEM